MVLGLIAKVAFSAVVVVAAWLWVRPVDPGHPLPPSNWGPQPTLPKPSSSSTPTLRFPKRQVDPAWRPTAPAGFSVSLFAREGLKHPRWLYELPNGDVFIAEACTEIDWWKSFENALAWWLIGKAGHTGTSRNRISLVREGVRHTLVEHLRQPLGMLLKDGFLYVGNTDSVVRYRFAVGDLSITAPEEVVASLPKGGYNNHWTRNLLDNGPDSILISVGSATNIGEHGPDEDRDRAAVLELNLTTRKTRVFSAGIRNPVGMVRHPKTGQVWTAVNERDLLGDDIVPDYLTRVIDGVHYGWPYNYWGINDTRVTNFPPLNVDTVKPDYALGSHTASLGLAVSSFPAEPFRNGMFVGQHGSWNRQQLAGYQVVFIPFGENGMPSSAPPVPFLTDFVRDMEHAIVYGQPVGVLMTAAGHLLVADDAGDAVWKVELAQ